MKIQTQILQVLLRENREMNVQELKAKTNFNEIQIYEGIRNLYRRNLIKKKRVHRLLFAQINPKNRDRIIKVVIDGKENDVKQY